MGERKTPAGVVSVYSADLKHILQRQHIPQLVRLAECRVSSQPTLARHVMEDLLLNGRLCLSAVLQNADTRFCSSSGQTTQARSSAMEVFTALAREHLVCRTDGSEEDRYQLPDMDKGMFFLCSISHRCSF